MDDLIKKLVADLEEGQKPGGPLEGLNLRVQVPRPKEEMFAELEQIQQQLWDMESDLNRLRLLYVIELTYPGKHAHSNTVLPTPEKMRNNRKLLRQATRLHAVGMRLFLEAYEEAIACVQDPDSEKMTITSLTSITPDP